MDFDFMLTGGGGSGGSHNVSRTRRRRTTTKAAKTIATIPAFPNWFPFNEMMLDGKLKLGGHSVKTRPLPWSHRGLTLLYSSGRIAQPAVEAHGYDPKTSPRRVILGVGELIDVRKLTKGEWDALFRQFNNLRGKRRVDNLFGLYIEPFPLGYFFRNLKRFKTPVPFAWPAGAVRCTNVPIATVAAALKAVGIRI